MKGILRLGLALALAVSPAAQADFSVILTGTTNYLYRGFSKSDNKPTVRLNVDYEHESGVYLGTWVSKVDFDDDDFDDAAKVEIVPYAGGSWAFHPDWRLEAFYARYIYAGKIFGHSADYHEFNALAHFRDLVTATIAWSPNIYGQRQTALTFEGEARYPLLDNLQVSAGIGYSRQRDALEYDYLYWHGGISWFVHRHLTLDLRYYQSAHVKSRHLRTPWPYDPAPIGPIPVFSISVGF